MSMFVTISLLIRAWKEGEDHLWKLYTIYSEANFALQSFAGIAMLARSMGEKGKHNCYHCKLVKTCGVGVVMPTEECFG